MISKRKLENSLYARSLLSRNQAQLLDVAGDSTVTAVGSDWGGVSIVYGTGDLRTAGKLLVDTHTMGQQGGV